MEEQERKYKAIKALLEIGDEEVSQMFGYKTANAFRASSARNRIVKGLIAFYEKIRGELKA